MTRAIDPNAVRYVSLLALLAGAAIMVTSLAGGPARAAEPAGAVLLVAKPEFHNPLWGQTVLLAAPAPRGGHLGIILNRPTDTTLGALFPDDAPSQKVANPVYFGGPFHLPVIIAVVRNAERPTGSGVRTLPLTDELSLAVERDTVDRIIAQSSDRARYYVGLVLWRPGELRVELERGLWSVRGADAATVLRDDTRRLWRELSRDLRAVVAAAER
ncbi:MAG: YqgE/AlgH family protein [Burkholderiales bacterium]|nr:YqgE/AlgH family protein [Burkholderiales bacterium]